MKIVHICQYYNDNYGYQENLLPKYQKKLGHEVSIITSDRTSYFTNNQKPNVVGVGVFNDAGLEILRLPIKAEFKGRFVFFQNLEQELARQKPDYIFHHGLTAPSLVQCAKYKKRNSAVFLAADNHADLNNSAKNRAYGMIYYEFVWAKILNKISKRIDVIFGVSPCRCFFAEKFLGIEQERIRLLPIGADTDTADAIQPERSERKNPLVLVTGGKWTKEKKLGLLLDVVSGLDVQLNIFGNIDDVHLKERVGKQRNVSFLGWQNRGNTLEILKRADIAIWPGLHTTLIEDAIAANTPVLLRYQGNTAHHIRGNGAYFFSSNPGEIRQLLRFILDYPSVLEAMKVRALEQSRMFSYDQVARDSVAYFNDLTPKPIHQYFMDDPLCRPGNADFERISL